MSDELEALDEPEGDDELDVTFHFASQAAAAVLALILGFMGLFAVGGIAAMAALQKMLEETGIVLPWVSEVVMSGNLHVVSPALGVLAAISIIGLSALRKPQVSWIATPVLLLMVFFPSVICCLHLMAMRYSLAERLSYDDDTTAVEPGAAVEVAREALAAFHAGLEKGVGTFTTPSGEQRSYFILDARGFPELPAELPPYEEARKHPGCVVLPWGPAGNMSGTAEAIVLAPHGVEGGISPTDPGLADDWQPVPWQIHTGNQGYTVDDVTAQLFPAVVSSSREGYSYAISLRRARVDTSGGPGYDPTHPDELNGKSSIAGDDAYSDALLHVGVYVFRGFDLEQNPTQPHELVPNSNVPVRVFAVKVVR